MLGRAHLKIGGAGNRRPRVDEIGGVQLFGAVVALIAARAVKPAVGAGALNIAIRQKAPVSVGIDLLFGHFADQAHLVQTPGKGLRQRMVLRAGGSAKVIKRQAKPIGDIGLDLMHLSAVVGNGLARFGSSKLRWCAVLVRCTKEQHLIPASTAVARIKISGQLASHQIAEVFDAIDVRNGRGDQMAGHKLCFRVDVACF